MSIHVTPASMEMRLNLPHKICMPYRPDQLVARARLTNILRIVIRQKLIALVAPAGYGKTSLLIEFAHAAALPVCWYTLDSYDADVWEFLSYLTVALRQHFPQALAQTTQLICCRGQVALNTVIVAFIREFCAIESELLLCFDDWHFVDRVAEVNDLVAQIIARCPNSHVVLASRTHPALPNLMLLAARRQVTFIDETQLRFSADELADVIAAEVGARISQAQAEKLYTESEGWITGVLLALQATRGDVTAVIASGTSISRSVHRFLAEQVFEQQPPHIQQLLCETSMLKELTASLCDNFLKRADSWSTLEYLLNQRLFVSEIAPGVLRYTALFREFLQQRLQMTNPLRARELGRRIAAHYTEQRQWSLAFDAYVDTGDLTAARQVLNTSGEELYLQGRLETLERAFAVLPAEVLDVPLLCLKARIALDRGQKDVAHLLAQQAAALCGTTLSPDVYQLQAVLARVDGRYQAAHDLAERVLQTTEAPALRGAALRTLGTCQYRLGQPGLAITTLQRALAIEQERRAMAAVAQAQHELAVCYNAVGQFAAAEEACLQAEVCWSAIGNVGRRALTRNCLALNQALTGHYREAYHTLHAALSDAREAVIPQYEAAILSSFGDVYADLALWDRAGAAYAAALRVGGTAYIRGYIAVAQINLLVQQQQYTSALRAIEQLPETIAHQYVLPLLLLRARIAGASGDTATGLTLARQATEQAATRGLLLDHARAWVLRAWLYGCAQPADDAAAAFALGQAARLCEQVENSSVLAIEIRALRPGIERLLVMVPHARTWLAQEAVLKQTAAAIDAAVGPPNRERGAPAALPVAEATQAAAAPKQPEPPHQAARPGATLRARYLGGNHVWIDNQALSLGYGRPREVLAYLVAYPGGATRTQLYRCIWGEQYPTEGSNALSRVIYRLRVALPDSAIVTVNRDTYYLDRSVVHVESDVERFLHLLDNSAVETDEQRRINAIWEAIELYRGPFLPDSDRTWCAQLRKRIERRYCQALRQAAEISERAGALQKALELFHQLLVYDPSNVAANAGVMRCHIALGEPGLAISQYRLLTNVLDATLGIALDPASEPERLYRTILLP